MWWILVFVFSLNDGSPPQVIANVYDSKSECETKDAEAATIALNDPTVVGWSDQKGCQPLVIPGKS